MIAACGPDTAPVSRAARVALEAAAVRDVGVARELQRPQPVVGQHRPAVAELHVDGVVGRRRLELGLRRAALLRELLLVPAAGHDQPAAARHRLRRLADAPERLLHRARADPVDLGREAQRRADGVEVRVDQARDDRAALDVDRPRPGACQLADGRRRPRRHDTPVANGERLDDRLRSSTVTTLPLTRTVSAFCADACPVKSAATSAASSKRS